MLTSFNFSCKPFFITKILVLFSFIFCNNATYSPSPSVAHFVHGDTDLNKIEFTQPGYASLHV